MCATLFSQRKKTPEFDTRSPDITVLTDEQEGAGVSKRLTLSQSSWPEWWFQMQSCMTRSNTTINDDSQTAKQDSETRQRRRRDGETKLEMIIIMILWSIPDKKCAVSSEEEAWFTCRATKKVWNRKLVIHAWKYRLGFFATFSYVVSRMINVSGFPFFTEQFSDVHFKSIILLAEVVSSLSWQERTNAFSLRRRRRPKKKNEFHSKGEWIRRRWRMTQEERLPREGGKNLACMQLRREARKGMSIFKQSWQWQMTGVSQLQREQRRKSVS